jgi:heterodisulfide reductase subunit A
MYTTKEAMIAYEHNNELETSIFYIDLRAVGKGFQKYLQRGIDEYSITYINGKVARIIQDDEQNPIIIYEDITTSTVKEVKFDIVVLATSMVPKKDANLLAEILGVALDEYNFFNGEPHHPQKSSKEGIFLCGACRQPMDIPTSVVDASGAAAKAAEVIMRGD